MGYTSGTTLALSLSVTVLERSSAVSQNNVIVIVCKITSVDVQVLVAFGGYSLDVVENQCCPFGEYKSFLSFALLW